MYRWSKLLIAATGALFQLFAQQHVNSFSTVGFRADANLVLIPVTVVDRRGAMVNGLRPEVFQIFEDKATQQIFSFAEQDVPASIGVILDMSGSMRATVDQAKVAVRSFLDTANPEDEAFLYSVSSQPKRSFGFTDNLETLSSGIAITKARGSTALIDTIYCGLNEMRSAHRPRKALLIISDGMDNHSRYTKTELLERVLESDIQIFSIAIDNSPAYGKPIQVEEQHQGLRLLEDLAQTSGGLSFTVRNSEDIDRSAATISRAIRNEYMIGYVPRDASRDGKWHSIRVKLALRGFKVYARSGYYSQ